MSNDEPMLSGFSGTLIDASLPSNSTVSAGPAAADPGAFLLGEAPSLNVQPLSPPAGGSGPFGSRAGSLQPATTRDLLRELESGEDYLMPSSSAAADPALQLGDGGGNGSPGGSTAAPGGWGRSSAAPTPSTPPSTAALRWQPGAPAIPEQAPLLAPPLPAGGGAVQTAPALGGPLPAVPVLGGYLQAAPPPISLFVPTPAAVPAEVKSEPLSGMGLMYAGPISAPSAPAAGPPAHTAAAGEASAGGSPAASGSGGSTGAQGSGGGDGGAVPRIASLPNLHLNLGAADSSGLAVRPIKSGRSTPGLPRCRSHSDLEASSVVAATANERAALPHLLYLTPSHLRKGKGGRQPAPDPRLDPSIDPKKARRIMANRLAAAKSKMKQKSQAQVERQQADLLHLRRDELAGEVQVATAACQQEEAEQGALLRQVQAMEQQVAAQRMRLQQQTLIGSGGVWRSV